METRDLIIIGGGASGLMAAIAAKDGCEGKNIPASDISVLVLDHGDIAGRKILATGNGKCNLTNDFQSPEMYFSESGDIAWNVVLQFTHKDAEAFFEGIGVPLKSRDGYIYPRTNQAKTVRDALLRECDRVNAEIRTGIGIRTVEKAGGEYIVRSKQGDFKAKALIIATGGKALPSSGSDGSGYIYAKQLGHTLVPAAPALVPLLSDDAWLKDAAKSRAYAKVTLYIDNEEIASDTGEIQFNADGISGIPVLQISRFAARAKGNVFAELDLLPEFSEDEAYAMLRDVRKKYNFATEADVLSGFINSEVAHAICGRFDPKHVIVNIKGTAGPKHAQCTSGGVKLSEVTNGLRSKICEGLFFAGEILDVDGLCGGYNLQWAWSSGYVAGKGAAKYIRGIK